MSKSSSVCRSVLDFLMITRTKRVIVNDRISSWEFLHFVHENIVYSSADGHLGRICILAIENSTTLNPGIRMLFWHNGFKSFNCILSNRIVGAYGIALPIAFCRSPYCFPTHFIDLYLHYNVQGLLLCILASICYLFLLLIDTRNSNLGEVNVAL